MKNITLSLAVFISLCCYGNPAHTSSQAGRTLPSPTPGSSGIRQTLSLTSRRQGPKYVSGLLQRKSQVPGERARASLPLSRPSASGSRMSALRRTRQFQPDRKANHRGLPNAILERKFQITPISWPSNRTVSFPVRFPGRRSRMRIPTSQGGPSALSRRLRPQAGSPTSLAGKQGLVSRVRNQIRLRQLPVNTSRKRNEKSGRDLVRQAQGQAPLITQLREQRLASPLRGSVPFRQLGKTSLKLAPSRQPVKAPLNDRPNPHGHEHSLPPASRVSPVDARKPGKKSATKPKDKLKPIPTLLKNTDKSAAKGSVRVPTTTMSPYVSYNGSDLAFELNRTLSEYGLDIDGLIALLQQAKGDNLRAAKRKGAASASWQQTNQRALPMNAGTQDNQVQMLTDLKRELQLITMLLDSAGGSEGTVPTTPSSTTPPAPVQHKSKPLIESTGNPVMDEMILRLLFQKLGGTAQQ